jgi:hypothetical protein
VEVNDKQHRKDATYVLIVIYNQQGIWMSEGKTTNTRRKSRRRRNLMDGSGERTGRRNKHKRIYYGILGN